MSPQMIAAILVYLAIVNVATFLLFWFDKRAAVARKQRVAERSLLFMSLLGGSPSALQAMNSLNHLTLRQPFRSRFFSIVFTQIVVIGGFYYYSLGPEVHQAVIDFFLQTPNYKAAG